MKTSILNRSFSTREKGLILALVIVLLVAAYYFLVVRNVAETQEANAAALEEVQSEIDVQLAMAQVRTRMQAELDELGTLERLPEVAVYDNLKNVLAELNTILEQTKSFNIVFSEPEVEGETVRRIADVTFTTSSYEDAFSVIEQMQNGRYRCDVTDFALVATLAADGSATAVNATLKATYFETTNGAQTLNGLVEKTAS